MNEWPTKNVERHEVESQMRLDLAADLAEGLRECGENSTSKRIMKMSSLFELMQKSGLPPADINEDISDILAVNFLGNATMRLYFFDLFVAELRQVGFVIDNDLLTTTAEKALAYRTRWYQGVGAAEIREHFNLNRTSNASTGIPQLIEKGPERILTSSEVMEGIGIFIEETDIARELSDEHGLYLLEVITEGVEPGETIEYGYLRKGESPGHKDALETAIHRTYYSGGVPVSGEKVAVFEDGKWKEVV